MEDVCTEVRDLWRNILRGKGGFRGGSEPSRAWDTSTGEHSIRPTVPAESQEPSPPSLMQLLARLCSQTSPGYRDCWSQHWDMDKPCLWNISLLTYLVLSNEQTHRSSTVVGFWRRKSPGKPYGEFPVCPLKTLTLHRLSLDGGVPPGLRTNQPGCPSESHNTVASHPSFLIVTLFVPLGFYNKPMVALMLLHL